MPTETSTSTIFTATADAIRARRITRRQRRAGLDNLNSTSVRRELDAIQHRYPSELVDGSTAGTRSSGS